jgi:hypothetical protein
VNRDGADNIVDLHLVEQRNRDHDDHATNGTDQCGGAQTRGQRLSGDRHQTGQRAVENHRQIDLLVEDLGQDKGCDCATGSGCVGVGEDARDISGITDRTQRELRTAVEAEPTEPQDERAKCGERHGGTRHRVDFAASAELAFAGAEDDRTGKSGPAANRVDNVEPAKSKKPNWLSRKPPPHFQEAWIG